MEILEERNAKIIDLKKMKAKNDLLMVVGERRIRIVVNGKKIITLSATPTMLSELALGFLVGGGFLELQDISKIEVLGERIEVSSKKDLDASFGVRSTECVDDWVLELNSEVESELRVNVDEIYRGVTELQKSSQIWLKTHGVHSAGLYCKKLIVVSEDVGRHNAVDKVLGWGLKHNIDFSKVFLVSSGRITQEMVTKCARCGIPIIVSRTAPINPAIDAASLLGVTLVCFVRGKKITVFSNEERIQI